MSAEGQTFEARVSLNMRASQFREWLDEVSFQDYDFTVVVRGEVIYLKATFYAPCCKTGKPELQHTRQWILHPNMTKSEVVQTAFKLVLTSIEHEARETFTYRGRKIFGPHFNVDELVMCCDDAPEDARVTA